jgi:hypothetical protein
MRYIIVMAFLLINLNAKIPQQYQQLSNIAYNYISNREYILAFDTMQNMLDTSVLNKDEIIKYRISNTMSALALVSDDTGLLQKAYKNMQKINIKNRDEKWYWIATKLSQKLTYTLYPSAIYHYAMCNLAHINGNKKYLNYCKNKNYFLNNFYRNYGESYE